MRPIDTDALREVLPALGIGAPSTVTRQALFDDDVLQQMFDVTGLIRRGRTQPATGGFYALQIQLDSPGGPGTGTFELNPYTLAASGAGTVGGLYPDPVPPTFDVWVISASAFLVSGAAADFGTAMFDLIMEPRLNAFTAGTAITNDALHPLISWKGSEDVVGFEYFTRVGTGVTTSPVLMRIPRSARLRWRARTAGANPITSRFTTIVGLFPSGMGQDIAI